MTEGEPSLRGWLRSLAEMSDDEWNKLSGRLIFLGFLCSCILVMLIFISMIAIGVAMQAWQIWQAMRTA